MTDERFPLNVPKVEPTVYPHNTIRLAVCELRFPTLVELEERGPGILQRKLRKSYPHYEAGTAVRIGPGGQTVQEENRFLFKTRNRDWTISFRASAIALETSAYTTFDDFEARLRGLVEATASLIESDFFTRVGLRYIDVIPIGHESPSGWINSALIGPLERAVYGRVSHFMQEVRGEAQVGNYTFRHGYNDGSDPPEYVLDFDFYEENLEANTVFERVRGWNLECYRFFEWAIGDKTRAWMMNRPKIALHQGGV